MYNEIKAEIEKLMIDYPEQLDIIHVLKSQSVTAFNCEWEEGELETFIKEDSDILNGIDEDSSFYEDVRNVQDMIITALRED